MANDGWRARQHQVTRTNDVAIMVGLVGFVSCVLIAIVIVSAHAEGWRVGFKIVGLAAALGLAVCGVRWFIRVQDRIRRDLMILEAEKQHIHFGSCSGDGPVVVLESEQVYTGDTWGDIHRLVYLRAQCLACGSVTVYDPTHGVQREA